VLETPRHRYPQAELLCKDGQVNLNGWGFVIGNHMGDVVFVGIKQSVDFSSPEEEEARACNYALCTTLTYGYRPELLKVIASTHK